MRINLDYNTDTNLKARSQQKKTLLYVNMLFLIFKVHHLRGGTNHSIFPNFAYNKNIVYSTITKFIKNGNKNGNRV